MAVKVHSAKLANEQSLGGEPQPQTARIDDGSSHGQSRRNHYGAKADIQRQRRKDSPAEKISSLQGCGSNDGG